MHTQTHPYSTITHTHTHTHLYIYTRHTHTHTQLQAALDREAEEAEEFAYPPHDEMGSVSSAPAAPTETATTAADGGMCVCA